MGGCILIRYNNPRPLTTTLTYTGDVITWAAVCVDLIPFWTFVDLPAWVIFTSMLLDSGLIVFLCVHCDEAIYINYGCIMFDIKPFSLIIF